VSRVAEVQLTVTVLLVELYDIHAAEEFNTTEGTTTNNVPVVNVTVVRKNKMILVLQSSSIITQ
jgi:hypothetical protein